MTVERIRNSAGNALKKSISILLMKRILGFLSAVALGAVMFAAPVKAQIAPEYGPLLKKYVSDRGVNYGAWKANAADVAALQKVVDSIARAPASAAVTPEQLAFHLNAYNAWILHQKVAAYPGEMSPGMLTFVLPYFNRKQITVAGEQMSFNHLESDIIRPRFKDPRIHFALNCASISCPPLFNEPFEARQLNPQLDGLAKRFVNSERGVKPSADGKSVKLSKIFDWYKDDFAPSGGAVAFINKFRTQKIPATASVGFQDYYWKLNDAK